ncbi:DUF1360 domain-containing protein [Paenibacillus psychroresistens]|uniref:DUF1360 domain-containing protein n=1 Tax=Paenibacillus psychroresistens TaxID=1778678 RepID=A0A6B8RNT5_9BACL|nr:DUF1360 domain-containing protein [Paenibacillus psychroresistens]
MTSLTLIILALACYRLTHLIVFDLIFAPIRDLFVTRDFETMTFTLQGGRIRSVIGRILICPWCSSLWVSVLITISYYYFESITYWICLLLTLSAFTSLIETAWMKSVGFPGMKPSTNKEENKNG